MYVLRRLSSIWSFPLDRREFRPYVRPRLENGMRRWLFRRSYPPPPLLPRTTFAEKYYNMEYVGSTYGVDAVSVSVSVSAMRFIDRKDGFIHLGRLLVCQRIKLRPTGHSIPMIAVRFDYAARCVRSFSPISSGILRSLGNILPCVFYRGATIVRSGVSIG